MFESDSEDMRTWKALPLLVSFLMAIICPVVIAIVFGIMGSKTNALLMQFEMILIIIAFCLTGILTRSKLRGLLSIFSAIISWLILFLIDIITDGWIANPYELLTRLIGPLTAIIESGILENEVDPNFVNSITGIAIIFDLFIVGLIALFLGFLLGAIATGIWKKNGKLSIISIIMKPFAAILTILIILLVPFTFHGVMNFIDGGISFGAGISEFYAFFGDKLNAGGGSQIDNSEIDLNDPEIVKNLTKAAENAKYWFERSSVAFGQVQGNILVNAILNAMFPEGENFQGINMREISKVLDISDVFVDVSGGLPYLLAGYQNFAQGFKITFDILGESSIGGGSGSTLEAINAEYNPDYNAGLTYIDASLDNFTDAEDYVIDALETAQGIVDEVITGDTGQFAEISAVIDEAQVGFHIIIEIARGGIPFLNATYETTIAVDELGETNFENANTWMAAAAFDLSSANTILQAVDTSELNPDSPLPFYGSAEIIKDMTKILTYFSIAAANGTSCYLAIEDTLEALDALDFSGGDVFSTDWNDLSSSVSTTNYIFDMAKSNMTAAGSFSNTLTTKSYGTIMDGTIKPMLNDFSQMINQFASNITEVGYQLSALEKTVFAIQSFTDGFSLFNSTFFEIRNAVPEGDWIAFNDSFSTDPRIDRSKQLFSFAIVNASQGHSEISKAQTIPIDVKIAWKSILYKPTPPTAPDPNAIPPSIAGLSQKSLNFISAIMLAVNWAAQGTNQVYAEEAFSEMDDVGLNTIFGI